MDRYVIGELDQGPGYKTRAVVTVEVEIREDGELSMTGWAKRPRASEADQGGQMQDTIRAALAEGALKLAPDWDEERLLLLLDTWDRWHLNNMRAGCEHQRANWDTLEPLSIYEWRLETEVLAAQKKLKRETECRLEAGETVTLEPEQRELMALLKEELPADVRSLIERGFR